LQSPFQGEVEVDESYFGAKRVKGKRGRGAGSKTPVFGILQRGGKVYTEIVSNCALKPRYKASYEAVWSLKALYIQTLGVVITALLTWATKSTIVCDTDPMNL